MIVTDRKALFIENLRRKKGTDFELIGDFTKQREKTLFRHNSCGYIWETTPLTLLRAKGKNGCPRCQYKAKALSPAEYNKRVLATFNGEYQVMNIDEYVNNSTKLLFLHTPCGTEFMLRPASLFINEMSCPYCFKKKGSPKRRTTDEFKRELAKVHGDSYILADGARYHGANEKVKVVHTSCGHTWETRANHLLQGSGCPVCSKSKGAHKIRKLLELYNVPFTQEHIFPDCRNTRPLPFDFAVFSTEVLVGLIEYDGEQHANPVAYFGGEHKFAITKKNDIKKDNYCVQHGIPLLRVPHTCTPEQIEQLVRQFLNSIDLL